MCVIVDSGDLCKMFHSSKLATDMDNNQPPGRVRSRQERIRENDPVTMAEFERARELAAARARRAREYRDQMAEDPTMFANLDGDDRRAELRPRRIVVPELPPRRPDPPRQPAVDVPRPVQPREPAPVRDNDPRLEQRVAELEREIDRSIRHKRPYYDVPTTRTRDLKRMLDDPALDPKLRENVLGMLEANKRYRWWNARHPQM